MATTAPNIPLVWTVGDNEQGVRLDYTLIWENGNISTGHSTCLEPGGVRTIASNSSIKKCDVTEDTRKRPRVAVKMRSDPLEVATASGGLQLWCQMSGISCKQSTTSGSITLTYDRARWVPAGRQKWICPASWWYGLDHPSENVVQANFHGDKTEYPEGSVNAEEAVIPFVKTREIVQVSAEYGRATISPDPPPPEVADGTTLSGYEWDTDVTLVANDPDECYIFDHWEYRGDEETDPHGIHGSTSSTVTLTALPEYKPRADSEYQPRYSLYRAIYKKKRITLTVEVSPQGAAQAPGPLVTECGSPWRPSAPYPTDSCDYRFDHWSDGETDQLHSLIYPTSDTTLTAVYTRIEHHLSVSVSGSGTGDYIVIPQQSTYHKGDEVGIRVIPDAPCSYVESVDGATLMPNGLYKVTMDDCSPSHTKYVRIYFSKYYYRVTTSVSPEGSGSVNPSSAQVPCGEYGTFTADPAACYRFLRWSTGSTDPKLRILVTSDKSLVAYFEALPIDHRLLYDQSTGQLLFTQAGGNLLWAGCRRQDGT